MATTHSNLLFHIVFSTKYRRATIQNEQETRLYEFIGGLIRKKSGVLLEIGGMPDHVHVLAKLSPTLAISDVLRHVKSNSSHWFDGTFHRRVGLRGNEGLERSPSAHRTSIKFAITFKTKKNTIEDCHSKTSTEPCW